MKKSVLLSATLVVSLSFVLQVSVRAQNSSLSTWTYNASDAGTGLNPDKYGGDFRPAVLTPDTGSTGGGSIAVTGWTPTVPPNFPGGIGSSSSPDGYGGIYTFFSQNPSYVLSTSSILAGVDRITVTLWGGGGNPTALAYTSTSLQLDYNGGNQNLSSTTFDNSMSQTVSTPIGPQNVTRYVWTWEGVSSLGALTDFSFSWDTQSTQHVFLTDISLLQVPEPSALVLVLVGGALLSGRRRARI